MNTEMLWTYENIMSINDSTSLVKNRFNGRLMIRKLSSPECFDTYDKIKNIRSNNLMHVYDVRMNGGLCESMCEYVPGYTLDYIIERSGPLKEAKAKNIMIQICDGLSDLHKHDIIHKDIKPSNVILDPDGRIKIIDFDISRTKKPDKTKDTAIFGTKGYASPEHFGFAQTDEKADIYSCGVLFNYLLTGKEPDELLYPGYCKYIIQQCMQIDKEKRFENAEILKAAIKGKYKPDTKTYRPIPGFRKKGFFRKFGMLLLIAVYFLLAFVYIHGAVTGDAAFSSMTTTQIILMFISFFICFTLLPYLLFGDVGMLSEKINPRNPKNGKYILNAIAILFIITGFVLLFIQIP